MTIFLFLSFLIWFLLLLASNFFLFENGANWEYILLLHEFLGLELQLEFFFNSIKFIIISSKGMVFNKKRKRRKEKRKETYSIDFSVVIECSRFQSNIWKKLRYPFVSMLQFKILVWKFGKLRKQSDKIKLEKKKKKKKKLYGFEFLILFNESFNNF